MTFEGLLAHLKTLSLEETEQLLAMLKEQAALLRLQAHIDRARQANHPIEHGTFDAETFQQVVTELRDSFTEEDRAALRALWGNQPEAEVEHITTN